VRINDRGPFVAGRCIDLARGAFLKVASVNAGVINARYEVLK
jgi:rare lipoprotein A